MSENGEPTGVVTRGEKIPPLYARFIDLLGDIAGKTVLECGCGRGIVTATVSNKANVCAFDLSKEMVGLTRQNIQRIGTPSHARCEQMNFDSLAYADNTFDVAFGSFIIHHLDDLSSASQELYRVLRPGGRAVFLETWDGNRLLMFLRSLILKHFPSLASLSSPGEYPLSAKDVEVFGTPFAGCKWSFPIFFFWSWMPSLLDTNGLCWVKDANGTRSLFQLGVRSCRLLDRTIYYALPFLRKCSYFVLIELEK